MIPVKRSTPKVVATHRLRTRYINQYWDKASVCLVSSLADLDNTLPTVQHELFPSSCQWENYYLSVCLEEGKYIYLPVCLSNLYTYLLACKPT